VQDAVDGLANLDQTAILKYAGTKKRKRLSATAHFNVTRMMRLHKEYDSPRQRAAMKQVLRRSLHERLRFGCYMSHVMLWQKALKEHLPFIIVLEDDVTVVHNFATKLRTRLAALPRNWDVLYLNSCYTKFGPVFDVGLRLSYGGLCTFGYAISLKGMGGLLRGGALKSEKPIDHVLDEEILTGHLLAFHATPPLVHPMSLPSTLAY